MKINDRIRVIRVAKGMTQVFVANKIPLHIATYNAKELGKREIKADELQSFADALGVDVSIFFDQKFFEMYKTTSAEQASSSA